MVLYALMSCKYKKTPRCCLTWPFLLRIGHRGEERALSGRAFCAELRAMFRRSRGGAARGRRAPAPPRPLHNSGLGPPRPRSGRVTAPPRPLHSSGLAPPRPRSGLATAPPRPRSGPSTAPVWLFHGPATALLQSCHGPAPVVSRSRSGPATAPHRPCHGPIRPRTGPATAPPEGPGPGSRAERPNSLISPLINVHICSLAPSRRVFCRTIVFFAVCV